MRLVVCLIFVVGCAAPETVTETQYNVESTGGMGGAGIAGFGGMGITDAGEREASPDHDDANSACTSLIDASLSDCGAGGSAP